MPSYGDRLSPEEALLQKPCFRVAESCLEQIKDEFNFICSKSSKAIKAINAKDLLAILIKKEAHLTANEKALKTQVQKLDMRLLNLARVYDYFYTPLKEIKLSIEVSKQRQTNSARLERDFVIIEKQFENTVHSAIEKTKAFLEAEQHNLKGLKAFFRRLFEKLHNVLVSQNRQHHQFFGATTHDKLTSILKQGLDDIQDKRVQLKN